MSFGSFSVRKKAICETKSEAWHMQGNNYITIVSDQRNVTRSSYGGILLKRFHFKKAFTVFTRKNGFKCLACRNILLSSALFM